MAEVVHHAAVEITAESRFREVTPVRTSGNIAVTVRISGTEADVFYSGAKDAATVETVLRV
ncbi:MAG: hypothetical protein ACLVHV_12725 [Oscillospiraceae bacterium]